MNDAIIWRLMWKEYRSQRGLWLAAAILSFLIQAITLVAAAVTGEPLAEGALYGIAFVAVVIYAAGCAGTLFATEHEAGTFDFQRALPVSATRFFFSKTLFVSASTLLLMLFLWLVTLALSRGQFPETFYHPAIWYGGFVVAAETIAWGILFSLVLRQPLLAVILALFTVSVMIQVVVVTGIFQYDYRRMHDFLLMLNYRLLAALCVFAVDAWLAHRWFQDRSWLAWARKVLSTRLPSSGVSWFELSVPSADRQGRPWGFARLAWQQCRQSCGIVASLAVTYTALVLLPGIVAKTQVPSRFPWEAVGTGAVSWLVPLAAILGGCVFLADQVGGRYRFLAERGVSPRALWWNRHLVWLCVLAAFLCTGTVFAAASLSAAANAWAQLRPVRQIGGHVPVVFGMTILCYTAGQTSSMFFRSSVLAFACSATLSAFVCAWAGAMVYLGVPVWWSVAPIPFVLLLATWLRAPDWMLDRQSRRARLQAVLSLALPAAVLFTAVPLYRIYEIPRSGPGFVVAEFTQPLTEQQRATAVQCVRLETQLTPWPQESPATAVEGLAGAVPTTSKSDLWDPEQSPSEAQTAWVEENRKVIGLIQLAAQRESGAVFDPHQQRELISPGVLRNLVAALLASAKQWQSEGNLEAAWGRYMAILDLTRHGRNGGRWVEHLAADDYEKRVLSHLSFWAAHPEQSADSLKKAIGELQQHAAQIPARDSCIKNGYLFSRSLFTRDLDAIESFGGDQAFYEEIAFLLRLMPWEQRRAVRLLDVATEASLRPIRLAEQELRADNGRSWTKTGKRFDPQTEAWLTTTPVVRMTHQLSPAYSALEQELQQVTLRRAALIQFALQAWRLDRGELPENLDRLKESLLVPLPMDPYTGKPFRYFPQGAAVDLRWPLPAGTPFLWSAGPGIRRLSELGEGRYSAEFADGTTNRSVPESVVLKWGSPFGLPTTPD